MIARDRIVSAMGWMLLARPHAPSRSEHRPPDWRPLPPASPPPRKAEHGERPGAATSVSIPGPLPRRRWRRPTCSAPDRCLPAGAGTRARASVAGAASTCRSVPPTGAATQGEYARNQTVVRPLDAPAIRAAQPRARLRPRLARARSLAGAVLLSCRTSPTRSTSTCFTSSSLSTATATRESSLFHGEFFWTGDLVRSIEAVRQSCIDARSLVAWLRAARLREVGVTGFSMGGSIAMVLAA